MIARRHRQAGFTLVEVMAGVMVGTAVALVLASAFLLGYRTISREARQIAGDQAVSGASLSMVRDLTSATTISTGTLTAGSPAANAARPSSNPSRSSPNTTARCPNTEREAKAPPTSVIPSSGSPATHSRRRPA